MTEVKWIKLDVGVFDNRKVKQIRALPEGDSLLVIWLQLLCLAGTINDNGRIYLTEEIPYTDQMLRNFLQEPLATVQLALTTFSNMGMIEVQDDIIYIANWAKYQNQEDLERLREQNRLRNIKYRQRKALRMRDASRDVTNDALEEERRKKIEDRRIKSVARFTKPTRDELLQYCNEKHLTLNVDRFLDYYESNGWKVGRTPMKDWKRTARNWSRKDSPPKKEERRLSATDEELVREVTEELWR